MEKVILQVQGMSCGHCEKAVVNALEDMGVHAVASAQNGTVEVNFDPLAVTLAIIKDEINDIGYVCA